MISNLWKSGVMGGALATLCMVGSNIAAAEVVDLSGRTVTLIHNAASGGSTGLTAQVAADAWAQTMAGNPTVIVQSIEGGALSRGIHQVMNSRPDGLTLGWLAWSGSTRILDPVELQIAFEDFGLVGGVGGEVFFAHVSTSAGEGLADRDELVGKVDKLTFAGFNPLSGHAMRLAGALDMLGVEWQFVSGMGGAAPLQAAMQRGEIEAYPAGSTSYQRTLKDGMIADGESLGLFYFSAPNESGTGLVEDATLAEMEPFDSYYRRVTGEEPEGPIWEMIKFHGRVSDAVTWLIVAPPGTPEAHLTMLRESFAEAMESEEFLTNVERVLGMIPQVVTYPEIAEIVAEVASTDEEIKETMRSFVSRLEQ